MAENTKQITPQEAILICQATLMKVPYTLETEATVGQPIREVIALLDKVKQSFAVSEKTDDTTKEE